jgi:ABC-type uncharacterized transport system ATPase subunit
MPNSELATPDLTATKVARSPLLEIRSLRKSFGGVRVLNALDFAIEDGSIRCLIGPNGSGKSTLLKIVAGMHKADYGEIRFAGMRIDHLRPFEVVRLGICMKFQIISIFRELTVYQNVRIPIQRHYHDEVTRSARIDQLLELVGLVQQRDVSAGILSHGEQQWLEIGMAIGAEPRLLLLDEPTAGMTPVETRKTADIVRRLNRERGTTIIVVEHDMSFVSYIDQPVSVLHQGRIFFEGDIGSVRRNPEVARIYFGDRR